jgi:hypothetical protein
VRDIVKNIAAMAADFPATSPPLKLNALLTATAR